MFCNKCGNQLPDGAQFCSVCGNSFQQEAPVEYESYGAAPVDPMYQPPVDPMYQPPVDPMYQPPVDPMYQPQPEPPKKKNTGLIVGITAGIVFILVAVFCVLAFVAPGFLLEDKDKDDDKKDSTSTSQESTTLAQGGASQNDGNNSNTAPSTPSDPNAPTDPTAPSDPNSPTTPTVPPVENPDPLGPGTQTQNTNLYNEVVKPVFDSKKITFICTSTVEGVTMPMTLVIDGDNFVMVTSFKAMMDANGAGDEFPAGMVGDEVRMLYKDGKYYMLMEMFGQKFYMEEDVPDLDVGDYTGGAGENNMTYVKTTTVKNGSKTYTCEEYKVEGGTSKFYFDGRKLVRIESSAGGQTAVIEVKTLSATADQKYFSLSGYQKFDESSFGSLM